MADVVSGELTRVRHTSVRVDEIPLSKISYKPSYEEIRGTVASVRLDSLLALLFLIAHTPYRADRGCKSLCEWPAGYQQWLSAR